jgi:opacity protein-like surface antigen
MELFVMMGVATQWTRMAATLPALILASGLLAAPFPLAASEAGPPLSASVMLGYRDGGRFEVPGSGERSNLDGDVSRAFSLGYEVDPGNAWELLFSQQRTSLPAAGVDVDIAYLHLGGRLEFAGHLFVPYIAGGVGATRISARGINVGSELRPSLSVAGGLEWPLTRHLALRMEARGYLTMGSGDRGLLCFSGPGDAFCQLAWSGDVLGQAEVLGGMTFRF